MPVKRTIAVTETPNRRRRAAAQPVNMFALFTLFTLFTLFACSGDNGRPTGPATETPCTGPVNVTVSSGTTPTFTWTPACTVYALLVEQGASDRWFLTATSAPGIASGVRYGTVPAGAQEDSPAIPLVSGSVHDVTLFGSAAFTPLLANKEFTP